MKNNEDLAEDNTSDVYLLSREQLQHLSMMFFHFGHVTDLNILSPSIDSAVTLALSYMHNANQGFRPGDKIQDFIDIFIPIVRDIARIQKESK